MLTHTCIGTTVEHIVSKAHSKFNVYSGTYTVIKKLKTCLIVSDECTQNFFVSTVAR